MRLGFAPLWLLLYPQSLGLARLHLLMIDRATLERKVQPQPFHEFPKMEQLQNNVLYSIHVLVLLTGAPLELRKMPLY